MLRESYGEPASCVACQHENMSHEYYPLPSSRYSALPVHSATAGADNHSTSGSSSEASASPLVTVMQSQNDITEFLAKQQKLSTLPTQNIPVFKGDPLEYKLFIRAFERGVENKTESNKDQLCFMEQYTSGQARDLVQSCLHMDPDKGFKEAKRLLKEHFGNEYRISMAYIDKALSWQTVKADDCEALNALALFLTSCCNCMTDMEYMEGLDNVANICAIVNRLPYKLREKWRSVAIDIQETKPQRPKFKDFVKFVRKEAKVALHPLFGDIKDSSKGQVKGHLIAERKGGKTIFTTTATPVDNQPSVSTELTISKKVHTGTVSAFTKPCLFCQGEHNMAHCKK